jgi:hypothetical protein
MRKMSTAEIHLLREAGGYRVTDHKRDESNVTDICHLLGNGLVNTESRSSNEQAEVHLLGNGSLKRVIMSTKIQQRFH